MCVREREREREREIEERRVRERVSLFRSSFVVPFFFEPPRSILDHPIGWMFMERIELHC